MKKILKNLKNNTELWIRSFKYELNDNKMQKPIKIIVRTKRIGKHRLNKIVSLVYERCDYELDVGMTPVGWWVSIEGRDCVQDPIGYGVTKKEAKDEFVKEFEKNCHVQDLLRVNRINRNRN